MQDVLEDYFGHQRAKDGRSDNPSAKQFGYNYLTIAAQRDIAPVLQGNVGGRYVKQKWNVVSDEPVKERKKKQRSLRSDIVHMYRTHLLVLHAILI